MKPVQSTCALVLTLLAAGCGGTVDPTPATAPQAAPATAAKPLPLPVDAMTASGADAAASANAPVVLGDWLAQLGRQHGLTVRVDPTLAHRPVAAELPAHRSADQIAVALAEFDLLLGFTRRGNSGAVLASVQVMPRGGALTEPVSASRASATATPVIEPDPVAALGRIAQELASGDPAVRGSALARSFELEAPLPAPTLVAALQSDASGEVRLYALMALARHRDVDPAALKALAEIAVFDAEPEVRHFAAALVVQVDRLGQSD